MPKNKKNTKSVVSLGALEFLEEQVNEVKNWQKKKTLIKKETEAKKEDAKTLSNIEDSLKK